MISGLDHIAVAVEDFGAAVEGYRLLTGREPELDPREGADRAWFRLLNMALEIIAVGGQGPAADRVGARLAQAGEGPWICAFRVGDLAEATRLATRRGLDIDPIGTVTRVRVAGLSLVLTPGRPDTPPSPFIAPEAASVAALDHMVIHTPNPDRAAAIYGGKLGLELRLDRTSDAWAGRKLYFRVGGATLEFAASLKTNADDGPDSFGGFTWRVPDAVAAHGRLTAAGFDVSDLRPGPRPGTDVFTVRNAPAGLPTLISSAEPLPEPR